MPPGQGDEEVLEGGGVGPELGQHGATALQLGQQGGDHPVNLRRLQTDQAVLALHREHAIEAAEQCGILNLPAVEEPAPLSSALAALAKERLLVFCDEDAPIADPVTALVSARAEPGERPPLAVLVGPEGGFHAEERALALAHHKVVRLALGPRILRADTAAVAALALVQAVLGDWG